MRGCHQIMTTLELLPHRENVALAEYVRRLVVDHLRGVADTQTQGGSHLRELDAFVKEFIVTTIPRLELLVNCLLRRCERI
jgi:fructose-1,6-bisphosphatase